MNYYSDGKPANALIQASDGNFYGTAQGEGALGKGTVFKMTPAGVVTTLHPFAVFSITMKLLRSVPAALPKSISSREPSVALELTAWKSNLIDWPLKTAQAA